MNGPFASDKCTGNYTYFSSNGGCNTIDYAVVSDQFMHAVENVEVGLFDKYIYDVHCPVS